MKKKFFLLAAVLALVDQALKSLVRLYPEGHVILSAPPLVQLDRTTNTGAAFGMLSSKTMLIAVMSLALMAALCVFLIRSTSNSRPFYISLAGLIGGGIGNLIDRLIWGGVTDYIRLLFVRFPIFNFADICITISVVILFVLICFDHKMGKPEEHHG